MRDSISASDRRLQGGSFDMLSLVRIDEVLLMSELSVPDRRKKVAVLLGLGLGRTGCGRSSSPTTTASFAGRKQLINMLLM